MENTSENYRAMTEAITPSDVVINEVMAGNTRTFADENGRYWDYIELYNTSGADVGHLRLVSERRCCRQHGLAHPRGHGRSRERLLLFYASGTDAGLHTNFRLSAEGESAVLANDKGQIVSIADYDILDPDQAFSRRAGRQLHHGAGPHPPARPTNSPAERRQSPQTAKIALIKRDRRQFLRSRAF